MIDWFFFRCFYTTYLFSFWFQTISKKYSEFINFPIYLWASHTEEKEVPVEEEEEAAEPKAEDEDVAVEEEEEEDEGTLRFLFSFSFILYVSAYQF